MDKINIIGAGIAGLALAVHLEKANIEYQIFEQAASFKTVGAGILLANNAMQIFDQLDLSKKLTEKGNRTKTLNIVDQNLHIISSIDLTKFEQKFKVSNIAIHRADLQESLLDSISSESIHLDHQLKDMTETDLIFQNGKTIPKGIVIGADGIQSTVRKVLFGKKEIKFPGQICWRGVVDFTLPEKYTHQFNESWGDGCRFGFAQINSKQVYWFALCNYKNSVSEWDDRSWKQSFKTFHPLVVKLLQSTHASSIHMAPISQLEILKKWHHKSICLIGDACHAMTPNMGQGAGQGIEDAYTLSKCLQHTNSIEASFDLFQKLRYKKLKSIVKNSWHIGKIAQLESKIGRTIRNTAFKSIPQFLTQSQSKRIFQLAEVK